MKRSDLSKVVGAGVLSVSLALVPLTLPSFAQSDTGSGTGTTTGTDSTTVDTTTQPEQGDRDFDWGWLGLLGLAGLAGLARKKQETHVAYREPDEVGRTRL